METRRHDAAGFTEGHSSKGDIMRFTASKKLTLIALTAVLGLAVASPARADWDDRGRGAYERHHEYYEHHRHHRDEGRPYGYYPTYIPAPVMMPMPPQVVYYEAPRHVYVPPAGLSFVFDLR